MRRSRAARCAGSPPRPACCCSPWRERREWRRCAHAEPRASRARNPLVAAVLALIGLVTVGVLVRRYPLPLRLVARWSARRRGAVGPHRADPRREGGTRAGARPARPRPDARGSGVRRVRARRFSSSRTPRSCRARSAARSVSVAAARRRRPCANAGERERSSRFWTGRAGSSCRGTTWSGTGRAAGFGSRLRRATWAYGRIATTAPTAELRLFLHLLTEGWYVPRVCGQHPCS